MKATTEARSRRFASFLLVPALLGLSHAAFPQEHSNPQVTQPIVIGLRQATQLRLTQFTPEYPAVAKVNYIQGQVRLEVEVRADGKIGQAHVLSGNPILAASALEAVRKWSYRPLPAPAGPSGFQTEVVFNFSLRGRPPSLAPSQAERDLARQVKPPEVSGRPPSLASHTFFHMRLLVNDGGEIIDCVPLNDAASKLGAAQRIVETWKFRPARWGTLPIPWYLDLDVPIDAPSASHSVNPAYSAARPPTDGG